MAKKTRKDKLRNAKKRQQTRRRLLRAALAAAVIAGVLVAAAYGAWQVPDIQSFVKSVIQGGKAGAFEYSSSYRQVVLGQQFDFAGGKMRIDEIHTSDALRSAFGGGTGNEPAEVYKPKNGIWLIVVVTFEGGRYAEGGTMDSSTAKVVDEDGNVYDNRGSGRPAEDVYFETSSTAYGKLALTKQQPQKSVLIFDISPKAKGLMLAFLRDEDGQQKVIRAAKLTVRSQGK